MRIKAWVSVTKYRLAEFDLPDVTDINDEDVWDTVTNLVWNTPNRKIEDEWEESGPDEIELDDISEV